MTNEDNHMAYKVIARNIAGLLVMTLKQNQHWQRADETQEKFKQTSHVQLPPYDVPVSVHNTARPREGPQ